MLDEDVVVVFCNCGKCNIIDGDVEFLVYLFDVGERDFCCVVVM